MLDFRTRKSRNVALLSTGMIARERQPLYSSNNQTITPSPPRRKMHGVQLPRSAGL
jgi:hypothetical protein